jgi:ATP-dependent DNA helicase RecQ
LTEQSRPLLRGETDVRLRVDHKEPVVKKKARSSTSVDALSEPDRVLWEALRERRRRIALEHGVPPYVIFHDATLLQMVEARPGTAEEMLTLSGIGKTKLKKYGGEFLQAVRECSA